MKTSKTQFAVLCAMLYSLVLSQTLSAEESYERFTVRNWTYRDGTEATGKLITITGPTATLKLEGEGTVRVPLEKLSAKDLNWIYEYHKRKKLLSLLPPEYRKPQKEAVTSTSPDPSPPVESTPSQPASEPSPAKPAAESMPAETAQPAAEKDSFKPFTVREFTLKDGTRHKAKLLSVSSQEKVTLLKDAGGSVQVPLDELSEKDIEWIIGYHQHNNLVALLPEALKARATDPGSMVGPAAAPAKVEAGAEMSEAAKAAKADEDPDVEKADTEIDPKLVAVMNDYRVWTDKQGKKSEAKFTRINGREVMFLGNPVGFINVHIVTLIPEDLQLLRDALKMHGRLDEIPLAYREDPDRNLSPTRLKQFMRLNFQRKWTDLSGNSVAASYVKMEDGNVTLLITQTGMEQEFPYQNFSAEDQIYVQERLKKEIPGNFFPETTEVTLTPEEREKEFHVFTDLNKRKLKGKFVRLAYGESVAVLNTGKKEELFITEFFSDSDLSLIKPRKQKQTDQLAMNEGGNPGVPGGIPGRMGIPGGIPGRMGMPGGNPGMGGRNMTGGPQSSALQEAQQKVREMQQRDRDQMAANSGMNARNSPDDSFPDFNPNPVPAAPSIDLPMFEHQCPICNESHTSGSVMFTSCPHCGVKAGDKVYKCVNCKRKFTAEGQGAKAPCPHCNSGFLGNMNLSLAVIKLLIVCVLAAGGYYSYNR